MIRLYSVFLLIVLSGGWLFADRPFFLGEEARYKSVIRSPEDRKNRYLYIKSREKFDYGISVSVLRNVPVVEFFICGEGVFDYGDIFFFRKGELCSKGVRFYPGRDHIVIRKSSAPLRVAPGFEISQGRDHTLIHPKFSKLTENITDDGRFCVEDSWGVCRNDVGIPLYPRFQVRKGKWMEILPLRERFTLEVEEKGYRVVLFSSADLADTIPEIRSIISLRAKTVVLDKKLPQTLIIDGSGLSSVRIPRLALSDDGGSLRGQYIFELSGVGPGKTFEKELDLGEAGVFLVGNEKGVRVEVSIFSYGISKETLKRITEVVNSNLPAYYQKRR